MAYLGCNPTGSLFLLASLIGFSAAAGTFGLGGKFEVNNALGAGSGWNDFMDLHDSGVKSVMGTDFCGGVYATYEFNDYLAVRTEALAGHHPRESKGVITGDDYVREFYLLLA